MYSRTNNTRSPSLKPIAAGLSAALALCAADSSVGATHARTDSHLIPSSRSTPARPNTGNTWPVTSCANDGVGSLRAVIADPMTQSGDTIDLTSVPMDCSTITLDTGGAITIVQADLTLMDTASRPAQLKISAASGGTDRVIHHTGNGGLILSNLTISNGYYLNTFFSSGGCIQSAGNVTLLSSSVANCTAVATNGVVRGGGVEAAGGVGLINSTVANCTAKATDANQIAIGGGIYAYGDVSSKYSTIAQNTAVVVGNNNGHAQGGGLAISGGSLQLFNSTVNENSAGLGGAIFITANTSPSTISNSTISGNNATFANAVAVYAPLTLQNSTVAKNYAAVEFGGVYIGGTSLNLQSSILANNTAGGSNTPSDLQVSTLGVSSVAGGNNLVMAATGLSLPAGVVTVTGDPTLSPLQFNGGRTKSHALLAGSPAIGGGNNQALLATDQRGGGYPRSTGAASTTDIGAIEFDSIFAHGFEF